MQNVPVSVGEVIAGKYKLERVLGQGGMGVVFAAVDRELERRVAIKLLLPEHAENEGAVGRFLREAKAAARIRSEHVVQVYETGRLPAGVPYIVMEFLNGLDLAQKLEERGALPSDEAANYLLEACEALAHAHAAGVIHRDLKPANLFLARHADGTDVLKVLDFGISKLDSGSALTKSATILGSPYYMSPEQLQTPTDVDARADVWALGVIAYELLSGRRPFDSESLPGLCVSILNSQPAPLSDLVPGTPPGFERFLERCLAKDRTERCQSVAEFAEAISDFAPSGKARAERVARLLESGPVSSQSLNQALSAKTSEKASNWVHTHRQQERRLGPLVIAGALLVLIGAGGAFFVLRPDNPPATPEAAATERGETTAPVQSAPSVVPTTLPAAAPEPTVSAVLSASASASALAVEPGPTRKPAARKEPAARTEPKPAAGSDDPFLRRR
jgi:eukaryotic-like serine/threonine-protein kinase